MKRDALVDITNTIESKQSDQLSAHESPFNEIANPLSSRFSPISFFNPQKPCVVHTEKMIEYEQDLTLNILICNFLLARKVFYDNPHPVSTLEVKEFLNRYKDQLMHDALDLALCLPIFDDLMHLNASVRRPGISRALLSMEKDLLENLSRSEHQIACYRRFVDQKVQEIKRYEDKVASGHEFQGHVHESYKRQKITVAEIKDVIEQHERTSATARFITAAKVTEDARCKLIASKIIRKSQEVYDILEKNSLFYEKLLQLKNQWQNETTNLRPEIEKLQRQLEDEHSEHQSSTSETTSKPHPSVPRLHLGGLISS